MHRLGTGNYVPGRCGMPKGMRQAAPKTHPPSAPPCDNYNNAVIIVPNIVPHAARSAHSIHILITSEIGAEQRGLSLVPRCCSTPTYTVVGRGAVPRLVPEPVPRPVPPLCKMFYHCKRCSATAKGVYLLQELFHYCWNLRVDKCSKD